MDLDLLSSNMVKEKNRIYSTLFPNTKLLNQIQPFLLLVSGKPKFFSPLPSLMTSFFFY
jgi:hypothetical protein